MRGRGSSMHDRVRQKLQRKTGPATVVGSENIVADDRAAANHLSLIRRFLIDFGARDPRASRSVQIFFAVHVHSLRSALMKNAMRARTISVRCLASATRYRCRKKSIFHRAFCNIGEMRAVCRRAMAQCNDRAA